MINVCDYDTVLKLRVDSNEVIGGMSADALVSVLGEPSWVRKRKKSLVFEKRKYKFWRSELRYDDLGMLFMFNTDDYLTDVWINVTSNEKRKNKNWVYEGDLKLNDSLVSLQEPIKFELDTFSLGFVCVRRSNACLFNIPYYFSFDEIIDGKQHYMLSSEYDQVAFFLNEKKEVTWIWLRNPRGLFLKEEN